LKPPTQPPFLIPILRAIAEIIYNSVLVNVDLLGSPARDFAHGNTQRVVLIINAGENVLHAIQETVTGVPKA
jgi:hypothetical protein